MYKKPKTEIVAMSEFLQGKGLTCKCRLILIKTLENFVNNIWNMKY